jgi:alkylation response protein AidB-like acyl-CoA dehydrogenase
VTISHRSEAADLHTAATLVDIDDYQGFDRAVRAFLDEHAQRRTDHDQSWGCGSDRVGLFSDDATSDDAALNRARQWQKAKYDNGFGWLRGPKRYGGQELTDTHELIYWTAESDYDVPDTHDLTIVGLNLVGPTIAKHGAERQCEEFLPALYRGDVVACQLFSEPGAGSDLAGLSTRAEPVDGGWLINGQKVWTSLAKHADIGELLCRTDLVAPKHAGITAFIIDMKSAGIDVRPLRQITGGADFNEVFFQDVFVPDERRLGPINSGWQVALTTLMNERSSVGSDHGASFDHWLNEHRLGALLAAVGAGDDPVARRGMAEIYVRRTTMEFLNAQMQRTLLAGNTPGPEGSAAKLLNTRNVAFAAKFITEVLGPRLIADNGQWGTYSWHELLLTAPALRILGGTDEIMKNIIAERVLGLPKEPAAPSSRGGKP